MSVVLLDTKMKRADGIDICRRICSVIDGGRVVVLTSYIESEERRMAYQSGASGYWLKEVDTPSLAEWIQNLVEADRQVSEAMDSLGGRQGEKL